MYTPPAVLTCQEAGAGEPKPRRRERGETSDKANEDARRMLRNGDPKEGSYVTHIADVAPGAHGMAVEHEGHRS